MEACCWRSLLPSLMADTNSSVRSFSAKELIQERPIFIKMYGICTESRRDDDSSGCRSSPCATGKCETIRYAVIGSLMSSHKNILKLLGCCLEFQYPALLYEDAGRIELLCDCLYKREREGEMVLNNGSLSWKSRLRIANAIANAVLYLHTEFLTPIIHRNLKPNCWHRPVWYS